LTDLAAAFSHPFSSVPLPLPEDVHHHPLTRLGSEAGDRHRDGQTVTILEFRSGLRLAERP
jgi:hypothetical protein